MKKQFEIFIIAWKAISHSGADLLMPLSSSIDLDVPIFDSEDDAIKWYRSIFKSEDIKINIENNKIKERGPNLIEKLLHISPTLYENNLSKEVFIIPKYIIE